MGRVHTAVMTGKQSQMERFLPAVGKAFLPPLASTREGFSSCGWAYVCISMWVCIWVSMCVSTYVCVCVRCNNALWSVMDVDI